MRLMVLFQPSLTLIVGENNSGKWTGCGEMGSSLDVHSTARHT
jgi:predicted ATPase